ncbi:MULTISPECIES: ABC transporter ATP-binding protein [unclassified Thermoplasma]|uniref:ABC transporter ATP-binding protein n=1 Tax=unclassified Thermoplasma TaxID=2684908 RepID=UPI000D8AF2A8|nr:MULTISPECIES: ABC transporter ATP-binding protein [unclassified Thermoplasma]PYB69106.1 glycerol-3-phosphate ABC transporter ATP-binding protein [Thermoplasma sp. Kam2015]
MTVVRLEHITRDFGKSSPNGPDAGLFDINLTINNGEFFVILGPSGSGKTTLLRIIAGLEKVDSGHIFLDEYEITDFPPKDRDMAMVFQNYALYPFMTVYDNIAFPLKIQKISKQEIDERVREVAKLLDIEGILNMKPGQISGGQRQRVALGRAIIRRPAVFLMDEPLSNLDAKLRGTMRVELKKLHEQLGITTIYVTHDQIEAMTLADRVAVINRGHLIQVGSPMDVYDSPANTFIAGFVGDPPINFIDGVITHENQDKILKINEFQLDVGQDFPENVVDVIVGIRPEDIGEGNEGFTAELEAIQPLGRRRLEYYILRNSNTRIVRATSSLQERRIGEMVKLIPLNNRILIFDKDSGKLLWNGKRINVAQA